MTEQPRNEQGQFTRPEHLETREEYERRVKGEFLGQILNAPTGPQWIKLRLSERFDERKDNG
jgi:hypothetical protein